MDAPKVRYSAMYTAQTRRKKKTWQDGHVIYIPSKGKLILKDDQDKTVAGHWIYREPREGEEIEFEGHIVQIESIEAQLEASQQPIELRVKPVVKAGHPPELQNLLDKWKRGQLTEPVETRKKVSKPQPEVLDEPGEPDEPDEPEELEEPSNDVFGELLDWDPEKEQQQRELEALERRNRLKTSGLLVELEHKQGDSVFDLGGESRGLEEDAEDHIEALEEVFHEQSVDVSHFSGNEASPRSSPQVTKSDPPSGPPSNQPASSPVDSPEGSPTADNHPSVESAPVSSAPGSPVEFRSASPILAPKSPQINSPQVVDLRSSPHLPPTQDDPPPPPPIEPVARGPSLESLLGPTNKLKQGLHGRQRDSLSLRDSLHDNFKTGAQVESDCELLYTKKAPRDNWIKKIPAQTPETGRWTWEGYWLVDYAPNSVIKTEPI